MQNLLRMDGYGPAFASTQAAHWRPQVFRRLHRFGATMRRWAIRHGTRRALAELDRHRLLDIGKTAAEARHESAKPFWCA